MGCYEAVISSQDSAWERESFSNHASVIMGEAVISRLILVISPLIKNFPLPAQPISSYILFWGRQLEKLFPEDTGNRFLC
jgi:hypothetical protein